MPYHSGYSLSNLKSLDLLLLLPWQFSHILYLDIRSYKLAATMTIVVFLLLQCWLIYLLNLNSHHYLQNQDSGSNKT